MYVDEAIELAKQVIKDNPDKDKVEISKEALESITSSAEWAHRNHP